MKILCILPVSDYDPTESAVLWQHLQQAGHQVEFATPSGAVSHADARLVNIGFGILNPFLMTEKPALAAYQAMAASPAFQQPKAYATLKSAEYDALLIPGGHAPGMRSMLESKDAQQLCLGFFQANKPVAAVCHGVLLAARTMEPATGKSVLYQRRTTALPASMEMSAWMITKLQLGDYYRTYPISVEAEVKAALANASQFDAGPLLARRDSATRQGFVVKDGNYLSARWPGDCYTLGRAFVALLAQPA